MIERVEILESYHDTSPPLITAPATSCDEAQPCSGVVTSDDPAAVFTWSGFADFTADGAGAWSLVTTADSGPATITITVTATDPNGNAASAPLEITVNDTIQPPPPSGSPYDSLLSSLPAPGDWVGVPGTEIAQVLHPNDGSAFCDLIKCNNSGASVRAWNSFAVSGGKLFLIAGGGHGDYGGNEIYVFDFATLKWARITEPAELTGPAMNADGTCPAPVTGIPAIHHWDGVQAVGDTGIFFVSGGVPFCNGGMVNQGRAYAYDSKTGEFTRLRHLDGYGGGATDYDPATGNLLVYRRHQLHEVDPTTWQIVRTSPSYASVGDATSGVFDPVSRNFYISVWPTLRVINVPVTGQIGNRVLLDSSGWGSGLAVAGSKLVAWSGTAEVKTYDIATGAMETIVGAGTEVPSIEYAGWGVWGRFGYIPELDVFWGYSDTDEPLWLFRLPEESLPPPPQSGNFQERCAAPGVVFCDPLDTEGPYDGDGRVLTNDDGAEGLPLHTWYQHWRGISSYAHLGFARPQLDPNIGSGHGSLRFEYPSESSGAVPGAFKTNFSKDLATQFAQNQSFFVQFRWRASCSLLYADCDPQSPTYKQERMRFLADDGSQVAFKIAIIGAGDTPENIINKPVDSCTALELVLTHAYDSRALIGYNACGTSRTWETQVGVGNFDNQYGGAYRCESNPSPQAPNNCFLLEPDEWITIQLEVRVGTWQTTKTPPATSSVTIWAAREGQPQQIVNTRAIYIPTPDSLWGNYGAVWLLPYMHAKSASQVHPAAHVWYDELIVSTQFIADPE